LLFINTMTYCKTILLLFSLVAAACAVKCPSFMHEASSSEAEAMKPLGTQFFQYYAKELCGAMPQYGKFVKL